MRPYTRILGLVLLLIAAPASAEVDVEGALKDRVLGNPDAPITIIEYASMTCTHCAHFHNDILADVKERYIDTGKAKLVFRDFPLDGLALRASMLARCAPEERYFGFIEVLFRSQRNWAQQDLDKGMAALEQVGRLGGVSKEDFDACMASEPLIDGLLKVRQDAADNMDVGSTPTFFVNGEKHVGALPIEEFAAILDPLLAAD